VTLARRSFLIVRSEAKAFNREDREGIAKLRKEKQLIFSWSNPP
jgi:hypothetical protein